MIRRKADVGVLRVLIGFLLAIVMIVQAHAAATMPLRCCGGSADAGQEIGVEGDAQPAGTPVSFAPAADDCEHRCDRCSICYSPALAIGADAANAPAASLRIESLTASESPFTAEPFHHPPRT